MWKYLDVKTTVKCSECTGTQYCNPDILSSFLQSLHLPYDLGCGFDTLHLLGGWKDVLIVDRLNIFIMNIRESWECASIGEQSIDRIIKVYHYPLPNGINDTCNIVGYNYVEDKLQ